MQQGKVKTILAIKLMPFSKCFLFSWQLNKNYDWLCSNSFPIPAFRQRHKKKIVSVFSKLANLRLESKIPNESCGEKLSC